MGFFKDLRNIRKVTKQIERDQFGTTNPFKIGLQSLADVGEEVGKLEAYEESTRNVPANGLRGEATITAVRDTGVQVNNMPMLEIELQVSLEGREPYTASVRQVVQHCALAQAQPGMKVPVRVDPENRESVVIG